MRYHFRMADDHLRRESPSERAAARAYLPILQLAAQTTETAVDRSLDRFLGRGDVLSVDTVAQEIATEEDQHRHCRDAVIIPVDLSIYGRLLVAEEQEMLGL